VSPIISNFHFFSSFTHMWQFWVGNLGIKWATIHFHKRNHQKIKLSK